MADRKPHKAPDMVARVGGPGALAKRTDLQGNQPLRVPTGLPYGSAGQIRTLEQTVNLPQATPTPNPAVGAQGPNVSGGGGQMDPRALLSLVSGHGTDYPENPLGEAQPKKLAQLFQDMLAASGGSRDVQAIANLAAQLDL